MKVEYKVRPIIRYIVTRYHDGGNYGGCETRGEYDNEDVAFAVAYALCKAEHDASGEELGSMNFIYPERPPEAEPTVESV